MQKNGTSIMQKVSNKKQTNMLYCQGQCHNNGRGMQLRDYCTTIFVRMLRSVILKVKFEINAYFLSFCVNLLFNSLQNVDMNGFEL